MTEGAWAPMPDPPNHSQDLVAAYERLRSGVLDAATTSGNYGLMLFLREGLAAWMAQATASNSAQARLEPDRPITAFTIADEVHGAMVAVLANMTMSRQQEVCA